jgi:arsenite methyltransferase
MNLYESPVLRAVTGAVIRPGGFALTDRGLARCRLRAGARVLDIGCGAGGSVDYLRQRHGLSAIGLDLSAVLLAEGLRTHGNLPLVRGRAEQLPMADGFIDAVLCECALSLSSRPQAVLQEAWRILQPGGALILTDVFARAADPSARRGEYPVACCLQGAVDASTVQQRIAAAGFEMLLWEDHSQVLKQLAANLILTYGSLDAFWSTVAGPDAAPAMNRCGGASGGRPGYYLLVARKPTDGH